MSIDILELSKSYDIEFWRSFVLEYFLKFGYS